MVGVNELSRLERVKRVLLLTGKAGTGKTALADCLADDNPEVLVMPLAASVKQVASMVTGLSMDRMDAEKRNVPKHRKLWQAIGDAGRKWELGVWVRHWKEDLEWASYAAPGDIPAVVVPDVRYDDEVHNIRAALPHANMQVWRLTSAYAEPLSWTHSSEQDISDALVDFTLENGRDDAFFSKAVARWRAWVPV